MEKLKPDLLVLAALLHDIGKLLERGAVFQEARRDEACLAWCPDSKGYPTHLHSAHTAAFCDWLEERFDCLRSKKDKSWKGWCAGHHRDDETALEASIIRIADRLSSSERDEGQYYQRDIHRKTLLEPVLERVFLSRNKKMVATSFRYPLVRLTSNRRNIFPGIGAEMGLEEMKDAEGPIDDGSEWHHLVAKAPLVKEYQDLCQGLLDDIDALSQKWPDLDLSDLMVTLVSLLERYTVNIPSATNLRHPDISLLDHMCTTAAIAQALYLFQNAQEKPQQGLRRMDDPKWLLVCGDFSGIQKFIYNLTNKGAAKGLRGRSFYVQHFCRVCADFILHELGLSRLALLYNSGGKFYLLLPANFKTQCLEVRTRVNSWLMDRFDNRVFFGIGMASVTGAMFEKGLMGAAWKASAEDLEKDRTRKFQEFFSQEFFEPQTEFDPTQSCSVCGSRRKDKTGTKCRSCSDLESLGSSLRDASAILLIQKSQTEEGTIQDALKIKRNEALSIPEFNMDCFLVPVRKISELGHVKHIQGECIFLNETGELPLSKLELPNCAISSMYVAKWEDSGLEREDAAVWDFEDFAKNARGIKRLGILRMDVDNLGTIFVKGLRFPKRRSNDPEGPSGQGWGEVIRAPSGEVERKPMASISRMVTLSRRLGHFFSAYIPCLLTTPPFDRCRIIYAGGDDLFVIGSWDQLPNLAETIHAEFSNFCCHNPDCTISGAITLQRGKYPIYKGAQLAGQAEQTSKNLRETFEITVQPDHKDGFCFLGVPVVWEDLEIAKAIKGMVTADINRNRGLLSFLSQMSAGNRMMVDSIMRNKASGNKASAWKEIAYHSWRWRAAYQLRRRYGDADERRAWADVLFADRHAGKTSRLPVYSWIELPLRWADYEHRDKGVK